MHASMVGDFHVPVLYTPVIYAPRYRRRLGILHQNQTLLCEFPRL